MSYDYDEDPPELYDLLLEEEYESSEYLDDDAYEYGPVSYDCE